MRAALDQAAVDAPIDQTQVLAIEGADPTLALGRSASEAPPKESRVTAAIPPRWVGKRLAKLLVPLIVLALLTWGLVAAVGGPTTTKVPNFVGMTTSDASALAARAHLKLQIQSAPSNTVAKGFIMRQSPAGSNTTVPNGTTVTLTVSSGPPPCCTVPDLTGMTVEEAQQALADARLTMGSQSFQLLTSGTEGTIVDQNPRSGGSLKPGDPVKVVIGVFNVGGGNGNGKGHGGD
jgi:serine/threonine-protein kinase